MDTAWLLALLIGSITGLIALRGVAARRRRAARVEYQRLLQDALDDGVLTEAELSELDAVRQEGALTPREVRMAALATYRRALRDAAADARLTPEEDALLGRLQEQLGLSDRDLGADLRQLSRLRMLARIAAGNLPVVQPAVPLVPGERCHWVVQCTLADRRPLPDAGRRTLAGPTFRVVSAEPFAVTMERDELRPAADILPGDIGTLTITSRRTIFEGLKRTFTIAHARAEQLRLFADGLRLDELGQSGRHHFLVEDPELTCAILLQAARTRRAEIRPARAQRST